MDKIKKNFGFGCMRFSMKDGEVDKEQMRKMVPVIRMLGKHLFRSTERKELSGESSISLLTIR